MIMSDAKKGWFAGIKKIGIYIAGFFKKFSLGNAVESIAGKIKANHIHIYYELHGKAKKNPIVLIAGFSCDHTFWASIVKQLAQHYQVLIFDNRGIGQTDTPNSTYTIEMMADDTMCLIHELGLKNPIIVGQSMGSAIAQQIGKRYGNQINKLILMNTFRLLAKAPEIAFTAIGDLQRLNVPLKFRVQSIVPWVFSSHFLSEPDQVNNLIKIQEDNPYPQSWIGYERQLDALRSFDSRLWLHEIKVPTLIIASEDDILTPLCEAKEVQKNINNQVQLEIIPGGHASAVEQPDKVVAAILNFTH